MTKIYHVDLYFDPEIEAPTIDQLMEFHDRILDLISDMFPNHEGLSMSCKIEDW